MKITRFLISVLAGMLLICISASAANFEKTKTYGGQFTDVAESAWYAGSVKSVYELGLMQGTADNTFSPQTEMSVAQAVTLAARLHSIYNDTEIVPSQKEGARWFETYTEYCLENGVMVSGQFDDFDRAILSYEMVYLFSRALPAEFLPAINNIASVPDVPAGLFFEQAVLGFYNAGVLNGNDKAGTFLPMSTITRMRASAILARIALPEERIKFTIPTPKESYSINEVLSLLDTQTVKDTLDGIELISTSAGYTVTAAEYRYMIFAYENDKENIVDEIKGCSALISLSKQLGVKVSKATLDEILISYYSTKASKYAGGMNYYDALEAQCLSDAVYAKRTTLNQIIPDIITAIYDSISPEQVFEYANSNEYIRADHILITNSTENAYETALKILLELKNGADFDEYLDTYGEDPGMKAREDGYIFTKGDMVEPFEKAAYALGENEISEIVITDYGYHIIRRLPFNLDVFMSSPDYATVATNAALDSYSQKFDEAKSVVSLSYAENFDGIAAILK